jgi:putative aldouronate transport system permease protein
MKKNKIKRSSADIAFSIVNNIVMILLGLVMVYPVYFALVASLSSADALVAHQGMLLWPIEPSLRAYQMAFKNPMLLRGYGNTLFVVIVGTCLNLVLTTIGAYFLSRKNVKLQKPIMIMIVMTMFFNGGMIPFYFAVRDVGLDGSLWALIIPSGINTFNLIIMKNAFLGIPDSIVESARIDGAGHINVLYRIILPVSKASLAVIALYYGVAH